MTGEAQEGDKVIEQNGVTLAVDKKSYIFLAGTELDYSGGLNGKGFVFNNPNAKKACGCGTSSPSSCSSPSRFTPGVAASPVMLMP